MSADNWANVIAVAAFLVSLASAVYAWKAAAEARVANQISIHEYQKQLYEAFVILYDQLVEKRQQLEAVSVSDFEPFVRTAALYVDTHLAREIFHLYDACLEMIDLRGKTQLSERKLNVLMDDLREREGDEWNLHLEEVRAAREDFQSSDTSLKELALNAVNTGSRIDAELMRKLKIART